MATYTLSQTMREKAERLALEAPTWNRGRSKVDGSRFCVVPASDGISAHYTNLFGCTCRGFARRGYCTHNEALKIIQRQRDAATEARHAR